MPRPLQPFQFHARRPSAVVRQSGSGRTTLHLELASSGVTAAPARGSGSGGGGFSFRTPGANGRSASGWRGRRGWWGSARRVPSFVEFWGLAPADNTAPVDHSRDGQGRQQDEQDQQQRLDCTSSFLRSPELVIAVLGLASMVALIVFIWDLVRDRPFKPMAVLVFVAAGTYCLALLKQQRVLAAAEQALVIEIIDGSSTAASSSRRAVISKEDRRVLFDYFTFRLPSRGKTPTAATATAAAASAAEVDEGGSGEEAFRRDGGVAGSAKGGAERTTRSRSRSSSLVASLASSLGCSTRHDLQGPSSADGSEEVVETPQPPSRGGAASSSIASPPFAVPATEAAMEEGIGERKEGMPTVPAADAAGVEISVDEDEAATPAPSSGVSLAGAEAELCQDFSVASGRGEEAVGTGGGHPCDGEATTAAREELRAGERPDEEKEPPQRGTTRGNSQQWSTAGSCIVCFGDYADGDNLCRLPCRHTYHAECIDAWLDGPNHAWCPLCKSSLLPPGLLIGSTATTTVAAAAANNGVNVTNNIDTSNSNSNDSTGGRGSLSVEINPAATIGDEAV